VTGPPPREPRRAALAFIFITVVLDMLALGMIVPVLPSWWSRSRRGHGERGADLRALRTVWALMQFVFSPVLARSRTASGAAPSSCSRTSGSGSTIPYGLGAHARLAARRTRDLGITAATFATAGAYIADVTPPEKRAGAFGMLGAAFGVGFVLGPAVGGVLGRSDRVFRSGSRAASAS